jgi:hypothetical protein
MKWLRLVKPKILPFILNHSSTLRSLGIGPGRCVALENGEKGTKYFLTAIRNKVQKLEKFYFIPVDDGTLDAEIYDTKRFSSMDWNWKPIPEDKEKPIKVAKLIEYYMLAQCPWPMVPERLMAGEHFWRPKFMGTHEQFLAMSLEDLEDYFNKRWEAVVGFNGLGENWDSEIDSDEEEEVDPRLEAGSDLASLILKLQMESRNLVKL